MIDHTNQNHIDSIEECLIDAVEAIADLKTCNCTVCLRYIKDAEQTIIDCNKQLKKLGNPNGLNRLS